MWREAGHHVGVRRLDEPPGEADLSILHVDRSLVPAAVEPHQLLRHDAEWTDQRLAVAATGAHGCRVCIIGGRLSHSLARTLVARCTRP